MTIPEEFVERTDVPIIKMEERKKKVLFHNQSRREYLKIQIDDGVCQDQELKCDKLLRSLDAARDYFVELKGDDVHHAVKQLLATVRRFHTKSTKCFIRALAVTTSAAPKTDTTVMHVQAQLKAFNHATLLIRRSPAEYDLEADL